VRQTTEAERVTLW